MKKKITVYVLLIALVAAMLVANAFAINYTVLKVSVDADNRADVTELSRVGIKDPGDSCHMDLWTRLLGDEKYYAVFYGMVKVGNVAVFETEVNGEKVAVEVYEVTAFKFDGPDGGEEVDFSGKDYKKYITGMRKYDGMTVIKGTPTASDDIMIVSSSDEKTVDAVIEDLISSFHEERS